MPDRMLLIVFVKESRFDRSVFGVPLAPNNAVLASGSILLQLVKNVPGLNAVPSAFCAPAVARPNRSRTVARTRFW